MGRVKDYYWDEICLHQEEEQVPYDLYWYSDELTAYQEYDIIGQSLEEEEEEYDD